MSQDIRQATSKDTKQDPGQEMSQRMSQCMGGKKYGQLVSEEAILKSLDRYFPNHQKEGIALGRGDDCCLLTSTKPLAVSSDLFIEDVHFRTAYATAEEIGHKALACNISDLAASGARPLCFTMNLGLPSSVERGWLNDFFSGMGALAARYSVALVGGDLSASNKLIVSVTVFGEENSRTGFLTRGGSLPGDVLFVVGTVGLARIGLHVMEKDGRQAASSWPHACKALLSPEPKIDAGLILARAGQNARPPALMDVSDGLARDLPRLLGMQGEKHPLGAELLLPAGALHREVMEWCRQNGRNPVHEALLGGDDYCLLGSCAPDMLQSLHAAIPDLWELGVVTDSGHIMCNNDCIDDLHGFDHFSA